MFARSARDTEGVIVVHLNSAFSDHALQDVFEAGVKNSFFFGSFELLIQVLKLLLHEAIALLLFGF